MTEPGRPNGRSQLRRVGGRVRRGVRSSVSGVVNLRLQFEPDRAGKVDVGRDVENLRSVDFEGGSSVGRGTVFAGPGGTVGYATTIGANCLLNGPFRIGRYCQLGAGIGIYGQDHPTNRFTTFIGRALLDGANRGQARVDPVVIGHDVWIGHGAAVLRGVTVGNGAVIGAGAIVTRDVEPYTIVGGNPAKVVRRRVTDEAAAALEELAWWDLDPREHDQLRPLLDVALDDADDPGAVEVIHEVRDRVRRRSR